MDWQAECGMCFRNVAGWTGTERFEVRRWPVVNYFLGSPDLPEPQIQLKAFLANTGVTAIVIDDAHPKAAEWNSLIAEAGITSQEISGVSLFKLSPRQFKEFGAVTSLELEKRAAQYRFGTLLQATDKYLRSGLPLSEVSSEQLVDLAFLPASWKKQPNSLYDIYVMPLSERDVVVGELGSPSALAEVIDRYRADAQTVYLPFPHIVGNSSHPVIRALKNALLPPAAMPVDGESLEFLGLGFDREQLHLAQRPREFANQRELDATLIGTETIRTLPKGLRFATPSISGFNVPSSLRPTSFRFVGLFLILSCELLALSYAQTPDSMSFDRFGFCDQGANLTLQYLVSSGDRPTINFGYNYGLLPILVGHAWFTLFGPSASAYQWAMIACNIITAWGIATIIATFQDLDRGHRSHDDHVGICGAVEFTRNIKRAGNGSSAAHHGNPQRQSQGASASALAFGAPAIFAKPAMGYFYSPLPGSIDGWKDIGEVEETPAR